MVAAPIVAVVVSATIALITLRNWRYGFLCLIVIGVLQDVLRKLTPGVPAYYILWSMVVFGFIALVALHRNQVGRLRQLWLGDKALKTIFVLYFVLIILHIFHSLLRWGAPAVPVFGGIFYLGPLVALLVVLGYAREVVWMKRFVNCYLLIMVPVSLSVYLSVTFKDSAPVLREVGEFVGRELIIYDMGTILYSYSGLLRVGEIAAFHAATCIAFLTIYIYESHRSVAFRIICTALILCLLWVIVLTGRRKMLMALSIFWVLQFYLLSVLRRGVTRKALAVLLLGLVVSLGVGLLAGDGHSSVYMDRGTSVFSSIGDRLGTVYDLFGSALERSSGLGLGAGVASQGMRYAGVDLSHYVGGASESGMGYLALELGFPGIVVVGLLVLVMARVFWRKLKFVAKVDENMLLYSVSFMALLVANLVTFVSATQLYGDYFVLIVLGIIAGFLYSSFYHASDKVVRVLQIRQAILAPPHGQGRG